MVKPTEEKDKIEEKLKYIGLDLNNVPDFINQYEELEFRPSRQCNDREYFVYQYVPINQIQILLTPTNRLADIKEKYSKAQPLYTYLNPEKEENVENFTTFLNMLHNTSEEEIEKIEKMQKEFQKGIPALVKYERNYLWQIYYSEYSNKYFMLVPTEELECSAFFYLLKEQIKYYKKPNKVLPTIYVPIINCVKQYHLLKKDDVIDIEKYLWIFTKNWPSIYEITDKENKTTIEIVGQTYVYEKLQSIYKIKLENKDLADKFYKLIKVLFILQTELPMYYCFATKINHNGSLDFYYQQEKIDYENLAMLIKKECEKFQEGILKKNKEYSVSKIKLQKLQQKEKQKENEYLEKQKEISTYLEYKKTFIGRVKYFLKGKKKKVIKTEPEDIIQEQIEKPEDIDIQTKISSVYTIEDLITIASIHDKKVNEIKNIDLDIEALKLKVRNLDKKIENAKLYIDEIDSHKKSIFEFWKFTSKDELQALNEGKQEEQTTAKQKIKKVFDYEEEYEEVGKSIDTLQRQNITKEEQDSIFAFDSEVSKIINMLKNKKQVLDETIQEVLDKLKQDAQNQEQLLLTQDFDIFGNISQDKTKIKVLGNVQHREREENLYQILNITEKTEIQEFKEVIKKMMLLLSKSINKNKTIMEIPVYKIAPASEKIDLYGYNIYHINPKELLKNNKLTNKKIKLFKINLPQDAPAIFYTNSIYYDNKNKTLPTGMNVSDKVLIDCEKFDFILKNKTDFSILKNQDMHINVLEIELCEYDIILK